MRRVVRHAACRQGWVGVAFAVAVATAGRPATASDGPALAAEPRDHLYGVDFVDARRGWVCGAYGTIFRTTDGGRTWQAQRSGTTEPLFDVHFADSSRGWIVGRVGTILGTEDGGRHWRPQDSPTRHHLFSVTFAGTESGWAVGDWGTIVRTRDGGRSWEERPLGRDVILNDVVFVDQRHGWIVGELGTILRTEDGGDTWEALDSGVPKTLFGVHFRDARNGWAVGIDALILRTRDGGESWQVQNGDPELGALEQVGFHAAFDRPGLYAVEVAGAIGFAVGELGAVWRTTDGGETWERVATSYRGGPSWLRALSLVSGTHGAIVGASGGRFLVSGEDLLGAGGRP